MKFGGATQSNWVVSDVFRFMFSSNNVPEPDNGVRSNENAESRNVLSGPAAGPGPGSTFPDTFQFPPVNPAVWTGGSWKVTILSSKMKSPWNPIRFAFLSIAEVVTAAVNSLLLESTAAFGNATVATVALVSFAANSPSSCGEAGPPCGRWT